MSLKDLTARLAFTLAAALSLSLSACGPVVVPLPPPVPTATSFVQTDPGALAVDVGVKTAPYSLSPAAVGQSPSGVVPLTLSYGLKDRFELGATGALFGAGRLGGGHLGIRAAEGDHARLGVLLGLAGYAVEVEQKVSQTTVDGVTTTTTIPAYGYWGLAPSLGLRGSVAITDRVSLAGLLRGSISKTRPWYGVTESDMKTYGYGEAGLGVVARPMKGLEIGAGFSPIWAVTQAGFILPGMRPTLSVRGSFSTL